MSDTPVDPDIAETPEPEPFADASATVPEPEPLADAPQPAPEPAPGEAARPLAELVPEVTPAAASEPSAPELAPETRASRHARPRHPRLHPALWALGAFVAVAVAAVVLALVAWPEPTLQGSSQALAAVKLPSFAGTVTSVAVRSPGGEQVPVRLLDGQLEPTATLVQGQPLTVDLTVSRPVWAAWLVGQTRTSRLALTTPAAQVTTPVLAVRNGATPQVRFSEPVRIVKLGDEPTQTLAAPRTLVSLGVAAQGANAAGQMVVSAAVRPWEVLSAPVRVAWFPSDNRPQVLATPAAMTSDDSLSPESTITLTFSQPVSKVLGTSMPHFSPRIPGAWHQVDDHTVSFVPTDTGYPMGTSVQLSFPKTVRLLGRAKPLTLKTVHWHVKPAQTLRLQQLFAMLGYLPVTWESTGSVVASSVPDQFDAAVSPPDGRFVWPYPKKTPPELKRLWHPGSIGAMMLGAIMQFEDVHGMPADMHAGPKVWETAIRDVIAGKIRKGGYSYVYVHSAVPTSLNLWHNGKVILTSPGNTGVPAAPTQLGTFEVFEHIPVGTMSGTNPSGTTYNDPGIKWISYFDHGEAIHAFNRASFGTPQSLGCVELPLAAAAKVWPYTPIGTLVTIER